MHCKTMQAQELDIIPVICSSRYRRCYHEQKPVRRPVLGTKALVLLCLQPVTASGRPTVLQPVGEYLSTAPPVRQLAVVVPPVECWLLILDQYVPGSGGVRVYLVSLLTAAFIHVSHQTLPHRSICCVIVSVILFNDYHCSFAVNRCSNCVYFPILSHLLEYLHKELT